MTSTTAATAVGARGAADVSRGWYEDLLTDWIPDALGGFGLDMRALSSDPPPPDHPAQRLQVHTQRGTRMVPLASLEFRAWAHRTVDDVAGEYESRLHTSVCGYRDADTPYREEWRRLAGALSERHDGHWIRVDIRNFFDSVDESCPALADTLPAQARGVMSTTRRRYGTGLLPGHRWSRRLANLALAPVDAAVTRPFVRWQDDYWLHADSAGAGAHSVEVLAKAAAELHLSIHPHDGVGGDPSAEVFPDVAALTSAERAAVSAQAVADGRPPLLKYLLRRLAVAGDPSLLRWLPSVVTTNPVLAPRAAMYLDACAAAGHPIAEPLGELLAARDRWIQVRLLAVVARRPDLARTVNKNILDAQAECPLVAVRALVARIQHHLGLTPVPADARTNRVLRSHTPDALTPWLPVVSTTL